MPTAEKIATVEELTATIQAAKAIYLTSFTGIDVASDTELRRKLRDVATDYRVVKNRLAKRAAEAAGVGALSEHLTGPTSIAFAKDDPVAPARILEQFINAGGKLAIKSGFMDGRVLTQEQVKSLATLPSRDELLARVVGGVQAPLYGFAAVLTGLLRNLVGVIGAIEKQQREAMGADAATATPEAGDAGQPAAS